MTSTASSYIILAPFYSSSLSDGLKQYGYAYSSGINNSDQVFSNLCYSATTVGYPIPGNPPDTWDHVSNII